MHTQFGIHIIRKIQKILAIAQRKAGRVSLYTIAPTANVTELLNGLEQGEKEAGLTMMYSIT